MSRSSKSRKKGFNPLKFILILGSVFLVGLVVSLFVFKVMIQNWVQGDGFQGWVRAKASSELKAKVQVDDVKWEGSKVFIGRVTAEGYRRAAFSKVNLDAIRATFSGFQNKAFNVADINVSQAFVEFSDDRIERPNKRNREAAAPAKPEMDSGLPEWLREYMPNRVEIGEVTIGSATIDVKGKAGTSAMMIKSTKAAIQPDLETGVVQMRANGGRLLIAKAPEMKIRDSSLRFQGKNLFINNAALGIYGDGHIAGLGEVSFEEEKTALDLDLDLSRVDIKKVVNEDTRKKVSGTVRGPVRIKGPIDNLVVEGTAHLDDGILESVPVLEKIAKYTKSTRFSRLVLDQAQADFTMRGDVLELRNIQIESDGLTRLEGQLDKSGEALAGVLQIGVTPGTLRWIPGAEQSVFTDKRDGFVWTTVKLGGTLAKIEEDLTGRLLTAAGLEFVETLPGDVKDKLLDFFGGSSTETKPETPVTTPEGESVLDTILKEVDANKAGTIEQGKKLLDTLGPLLGK